MSDKKRMMRITKLHELYKQNDIKYGRGKSDFIEYDWLNVNEKRHLNDWINGCLMKSKQQNEADSTEELRERFSGDPSGLGFYVTNGMMKVAMLNAGYSASYKWQHNWHFNSAYSVDYLKRLKKGRLLNEDE